MSKIVVMNLNSFIISHNHHPTIPPAHPKMCTRSACPPSILYKEKSRQKMTYNNTKDLKKYHFPTTKNKKNIIKIGKFTAIFDSCIV